MNPESDVEISIIVSAYNRKDFLRRTLENLIAENLRSFELVVVDDGSTDGTVDSVSDLPVRILRQPENLGVAAALNRGVAAATGRYLAFADSDDLVSPGSLARRLEFITARPDEVAVASPFTDVIGILDEKLAETEIMKTRMIPYRLSLGWFSSGKVFPTSLSFYLFRTGFFRTLLPLDCSLKICHDADFIFRVLRQVTIPVLDQPAVLYRLHDQNLSLERNAGAVRARRRAQAESWLVHAAHHLI